MPKLKREKLSKEEMEKVTEIAETLKCGVGLVKKQIGKIGKALVDLSKN